MIKPGDVQWMTAGSGVVHDEFHSTDFSAQGGVFEMVQLWVNLPKKHKMTKPKYQGIKNSEIPKVNIGKNSTLRVLAGALKNRRGTASTFTKINIFDVVSAKKDEISINLEKETNTVLLILKGSVLIQGKSYGDQSVIIFERDGVNLAFESSDDFKGLLLNGEPIDEPMFSHGPR